MKLNNITREIVEQYQKDGVDMANVMQFIIQTPINVVAIITGEGSKSLQIGTDVTVAKLAIVLNAILIHHFDSVQEFYDTFGISKYLYDRLWTGEVKISDLRRSLITSVIKSYNINPLFIYGEDIKVDMYLKKQAS